MSDNQSDNSDAWGQARAAIAQPAQPAPEQVSDLPFDQAIRLYAQAAWHHDMAGMRKGYMALQALCSPPAQQADAQPVAWTTMPDTGDWTFISGSKDPNGALPGKWHPLFAAAPPARQPQWLPIETAPQDGKKLTLFYKNRNGLARTVMARWLTDEQAAETDSDGVGLEGGWYECIDNWDDYTEVAIHEGEPSHWMPLPPPPGGIGEGEKP